MVVCALANQSCLVPQSIDASVDSPHPAPRFVVDLIPTYLLSPVLQLYRQGSADAAHVPPCHCELNLSGLYVDEDDPTVTLEVRWFVDYDTTVPLSQHPVNTPEFLPGDFNTTNTRRQLNSFFFDADTLGINTDGVHTVDVVVAETAAWDNSPTAPLRFRAVLPGYSSAVFRFFINVRWTQDASRPTCPSTPLSTKLPAGCP